MTTELWYALSTHVRRSSLHNHSIKRSLFWAINPSQLAIPEAETSIVESIDICTGLFSQWTSPPPYRYSTTCINPLHTWFTVVYAHSASRQLSSPTNAIVSIVQLKRVIIGNKDSAFLLKAFLHRCSVTNLSIELPLKGASNTLAHASFFHLRVARQEYKYYANNIGSKTHYLCERYMCSKPQ